MLHSIFDGKSEKLRSIIFIRPFQMLKTRKNYSYLFRRQRQKENEAIKKDYPQFQLGNISITFTQIVEHTHT